MSGNPVWAALIGVSLGLIAGLLYGIAATLRDILAVLQP